MVSSTNHILSLVTDRHPATGLYNPFPTFSFHGSIRPVYPLSPMRIVPKSINHPDWAKTGIPMGERRLSRTKINILDVKGQEAMRKVCRLAREVLDITAAELKPGISTDYLDEVCHKACVDRKVRRKLFKPIFIGSNLDSLTLLP
jgi:methionyl aminopeptidase